MDLNSESDPIVTPTTSAVKKRRGIKVTDILFILVIVVAIGFLAKTLLSQLSVRSTVNSASATTSKVITAMQKQDAPAARKLGDAKFQAAHSDQQLAGLFAQAKPYVSGTPSIVKKTLDTGSVAKVVSIYYKFDDKKPFYVRVTVREPNGSTAWQLINFSGNTSLTTLTK